MAIGAHLRLDISDLRLFLSIVDAGSITRGAAQAHLALASASERLRNMEEDAGLPLLERRARGIIPTEAGEALAHHARLILKQQAALRGELQDFADGASGTLHLYANTGALTGFLTSALTPWLSERPRLHVRLIERTSSEIVRLIAAGLAEAGVVSDAIEKSALQDGLIIQPVISDHLVLIVPGQHELATTKRCDLKQLLDQPFVGLTADHALQEYLGEKARLLNQGRDLKLRICVKTIESQCEMVAHGIGVGIVPAVAARRYRRAYGYRVVALSDAWARRQLCVVYRDWAALPERTRSLLLHLGANGKPLQR